MSVMHGLHGAPARDHGIMDDLGAQRCGAERSLKNDSCDENTATSEKNSTAPVAQVSNTRPVGAS
jgi:hypothetical protein